MRLSDPNEEFLLYESDSELQNSANLKKINYLMMKLFLRTGSEGGFGCVAFERREIVFAIPRRTKRLVERSLYLADSYLEVCVCVGCER